MIKIIMGQKGTGKTKAFVNIVNEAIGDEKGNVVCITKGNRLLYDLKSSVRFVDTSDFDIDCYYTFYGFICGIISRDFDITHIFVDNLSKIVSDDFSKIDKFLDLIFAISKQFNIKFTISISADVETATDAIKKYLIDY